MSDNKCLDLKGRFDAVGDALDGLSPHDCFGLLMGYIGMLITGYTKIAPQNDVERPEHSANSPMPKLPTWEETRKAYFDHLTSKGLFALPDSIDAIRFVHEFICRQLQQ